MINKIKNNKIIRYIFKTFEFIFFACVILYVAIVFFQKNSNNSSILGYRFFTVASESMVPVYEIGDVLIVKDINYNSLKIGDDITYYGTEGDFADKIITHRIIDINKKENKLTTKGIANEISDKPINASQIYGKVVKKLMLISLITKIIRNQYGFFFLVFAPLVIIIFLEFADIFLTKETDDDNN